MSLCFWYSFKPLLHCLTGPRAEAQSNLKRATVVSPGIGVEGWGHRSHGRLQSGIWETPTSDSSSRRRESPVDDWTKTFHKRKPSPYLGQHQCQRGASSYWSSEWLDSDCHRTDLYARRFIKVNQTLSGTASMPKRSSKLLIVWMTWLRLPSNRPLCTPFNWRLIPWLLKISQLLLVELRTRYPKWSRVVTWRLKWRDGWEM